MTNIEKNVLKQVNNLTTDVIEAFRLPDDEVIEMRSYNLIYVFLHTDTQTAHALTNR